MGNLTIFKNQTGVSRGTRELSELAKSLLSSTMSRRIQTNTNGTFRRLVNGEKIGDALRGEINVIIVDLLPKVSRIYYKDKYDPNKEATPPECWSNLGDKPEPSVEDPQHTNCAECPMNIKGSGENGSRACRFNRRLAVLVEGDTSGEVYQFNIPAKSIFGKGTGNVHPFESYVKFLLANGHSPDNVVTNISYDENAEQMELLFTPLREIGDEGHEYEPELVAAAQADPATKRYTTITAFHADNQPSATKKLASPVAKPEKKVEAKPKVQRSEEPDDDGDAPPPVKRETKKAQTPARPKADLAAIVNEWGSDEE